MIGSLLLTINFILLIILRYSLKRNVAFEKLKFWGFSLKIFQLFLVVYILLRNKPELPPVLGFSILLISFTFLVSFSFLIPIFLSRPNFLAFSEKLQTFSQALKPAFLKNRLLLSRLNNYFLKKNSYFFTFLMNNENLFILVFVFPFFTFYIILLFELFTWHFKLVFYLLPFVIVWQRLVFYLISEAFGYSGTNMHSELHTNFPKVYFSLISLRKDGLDILFNFSYILRLIRYSPKVLDIYENFPKIDFCLNLAIRAQLLEQYQFFFQQLRKIQNLLVLLTLTVFWILFPLFSFVLYLTVCFILIVVLAFGLKMICFKPSSIALKTFLIQLYPFLLKTQNQLILDFGFAKEQLDTPLFINKKYIFPKIVDSFNFQLNLTIFINFLKFIFLFIYFWFYFIFFCFLNFIFSLITWSSTFYIILIKHEIILFLLFSTFVIFLYKLFISSLHQVIDFIKKNHV